ncbi:hypothetical protein AN958_09658 [Leucoagaricus sp. SymC.cos]|nr:hypothetical protein AN958_09658 [Leucoagaricus sp. SymC.cos]
MPHHVHHHPLQRPQQSPTSNTKPESKKRQGFFARLLGPSSSTESSSSGSSSNSSPPSAPHPTDPGSKSKSDRDTMLRMQRPQHPPQYDTMGQRPAPVPIPGSTPMSQPQPQPSRSAPEVHRAVRPTLRQRAKTVGAPVPSTVAGDPERVIVPAVAAAAGRAADDRRLRQDLDRIDELDETNPFGRAVHHGGPYEAISKFVQKDATQKQNERAPHDQAPGGHNLVMTGDVYANAQLMALQKGSLNLKPGQILPHRHHDHHPRHAHPKPDVSAHEPRTSLERPAHTQKVPSVLRADSLGNYPASASVSASSLTDSPPTQRRTPSPAAATACSDEAGDAGLAIGLALMGNGQNDSSATSDSVTVVGIEADSPTPIKIVLKEPTEVDEPSPPPYQPDPPQASTSRVDIPVVNDYWSPEPMVVEGNHLGPVWESPSNMHQQLPPQMPMPQFTPTPVPIPASQSSSSLSRHASWQAQPVQVSSQLNSRPSRQEIYSLQPPPRQQPVNNSGLSRSSTYAPGFSGPQSDRLMLASSLKAGTGVPPSSSSLSLRDRESDVRSVQQSIMTTSNASNRSYGENPPRNRYLPKRLVMPAPLQPTMQNQAATTHQVRFDPQANPIISNYSRDPSPPKSRRSSLAPQAPRAQEISMVQSNGKLRKGISLIGGLKSSKEGKEQTQPPPPAPLPVSSVSFSANIVSADRHARGAEKVHKKVLSKRR